MSRGQELNVRSDLYFITDGDGRHVERHKAEVDENPGADQELKAVLAVQRRSYLGGLTQCAQKLAKDSLPLFGLVGSAVVELFHQPSRSEARLGELRVVGGVEIAGQHALELAA